MSPPPAATLLDYWPTPEALAAVAPADAAARSDAALVAGHQPPPLRLSSGEPADERAALAALLAPLPAGGSTVVSLAGPPGSGKTHLLRWLGLHAGANRQVLFVRRGVEEVLAQLGTPVEPPAPREEPDEAAAAERVVEHFRAALRQRTAEARAACDDAVARGERPAADERAVAETHGDGLVALLAGPTRDALLRDTPRRPSVLRRLAAGDPEPGAFEPADFEFADVNSARLTDPRAQRYVAKLKTNLQYERAVAAALMNATLPTPVAPADPFALARAASAAAGRELVLLVDGDAPELLEAVAASDGPGRCAVRVAVVVSEAVPEGEAFILGEVPDAADLAGAVLNAARLGPDRLAVWFEDAGREPDAVPPTFAAELPDADRAALEAAGASARGHALFPLDRAALQNVTPGRLVREVLAAALAGRDEFARRELAPVVEPITPATPPVDAALGALAVALGRLPVPAPDDIVRFLAAAHTTGAPLDLLTPGVLEWLRAHGQTGALRVRVG